MTEIKKTGKYKIPKDNLTKIKKDFLSASVIERETRKIITNLSGQPMSMAIIVDPHTAVGLAAIVTIISEDKDSGVNTANTIALATAHSAKFPEASNFARLLKSELPKELKHVMKEKENFEIVKNDLKKVKDYILKKI